MKNNNKKWLKICFGTLGLFSIVCIIPVSIVSCSKVDTSSSNEVTQTVSSISNQWASQFNNIENSSNFENYVNKWLNTYTNDLSSNFASYAKNWVTLTNTKLPTNLEGYVSNSLSTAFKIPDLTSSSKDESSINETTNLYYKIDGASLVANSLKENSNHQFSFSILYKEDYELIINSNFTNAKNTNTGIKSIEITADYQNVSFTPTLLGNLDDLLNKNNTNVQVDGGWYLSSGDATFKSSIFDNNASSYKINFDKTANPTSNSWIASSSICSPISVMWTNFLTQTANDSTDIGTAIKYQMNNSLWYTHFQNSIISGYATDLNGDLINLSSIANQNLNSLDELEKDSLDIIYPDPNISTNNSTSSSTPSSTQSDNGTTSQQMDQLENEIQKKLDSLGPVFDPIKTKIENEVKEAIASTSNTDLLNTLQKIWNTVRFI